MTIEQFEKAKRLISELNMICKRLRYIESGFNARVCINDGSLECGFINDYPINREDVLKFLQSRKESIEKELEAL